MKFYKYGALVRKKGNILSSIPKGSRRVSQKGKNDHFLVNFSETYSLARKFGEILGISLRFGKQRYLSVANRSRKWTIVNESMQKTSGDVYAPCSSFNLSITTLFHVRQDPQATRLDELSERYKKYYF